MRIPFVALALACASGAEAQCLFTTVAQQSVGPSCNQASTGMCAIVALPPWLESSLDIANCRLGVDLVVFEGCGATVPVRALLVGFQPATVPLPDLGLACALHLLPIGVLVAASGPFALDLPPGVTAFSFLMQGAALSVPPFATEAWFTLTEGYQVDLS